MGYTSNCPSPISPQVYWAGADGAQIFQGRRSYKSNHEMIMASVCKHPRVRIVSRHDDTEFVECLECGEIFDSEEFHDMEIEEVAKAEQTESDS